MISRPKETEFAPFFKDYVALVPETEIVGVLEHQREDLKKLAAAVPTEREQFRYADGKWSIREVMGHLIDAERVFGYRAFCISRKEQASLPSFDENLYVAESCYDSLPLRDLHAELEIVRNGNLAFYRHLDDSAWQLVGTASRKPVSVRALAFITAGHVRHHLHILRERYGLRI